MQKKVERKIVYGVTDRRQDSFIQKISDTFIDYSPVSNKEKSLLFNSLQLLVSSGVGLVRALEMLAQRQRNKRLQRILNTVVYDMTRHGMSFSKALEKYPTIFSETETKIIYAGEISGTMEENLVSLSKQISKNIEIQIKIKSALMYPATVIGAIIIAASVLMMFVIPKFVVLFAEFPASELPIATRFLIGSSDFVRNFWWFILTVFIGGWFLFQNWKNSEIGKRQWDSFLFGIPVLRKLILNIQTLKIASNFATLIEAGIPVAKSFRILGQIISNTVVADAIFEVEDEVVKGKSINQAFREKKVFDPILGEVLEIGEKGGDIPSILKKTAMQYENEIDAQIKNMNTVIEPLIIIIMGGAVVFMAIAILTPIFKLQGLFAS